MKTTARLERELLAKIDALEMQMKRVNHDSFFYWFPPKLVPTAKAKAVPEQTREDFLRLTGRAE